MKENDDEIADMKLRHEKEIKTLREEIQFDVKKQISELISKLKPDMLIKALS